MPEPGHDKYMDNAINVPEILTGCITVHGVLAGCYKSKAQMEKSMLLHASANNGRTSICGKVKEHALCDETYPLDRVTCQHCVRKLAKLAK